jgi:hypothetical protein
MALSLVKKKVDLYRAKVAQLFFLLFGTGK